jgi:hypothetical protein
MRLESNSYSVKATIFRAFTIASLIMFLVGVVGFSNGLLSAVRWAPWIRPTTPLPMGNPHSIAVDSKGNVYLAAYFYYRIQKYSPEGIFIRSWTCCKSPRLRINAKDQLELADDNTTRNAKYPDILTVFDSDGNVISSKTVDGCHREFGKNSETFCRDKVGNTYSIHSRYLRPYVLKTDRNGISVKVVEEPLWLWFFQGPFPAWIFFAAGLFLFWKSLEKYQTAKKNEQIYRYSQTPSGGC